MSGRYGQMLTCGLHGVAGVMMEAEVALLPGLPSFEIVGMGDSVVRESRNRIRAAVRAQGYDFPRSRIIASLAPAWVRKGGSSFDLPLALALLAAGGAIHRDHTRTCAFGELSLTGDVRPVPGAISRALAGQQHEVGRLLLPARNLGECACVDGIQLIPVRNLREAVAALNDQSGARAVAHPAPPVDEPVACPDLSSIAGQTYAKRALVIAACGWHNLLLLGSPGSGKSSLAAAIPGILPALTAQEARAVMRIHSAAGLLMGSRGPLTQRPFRAPHHTATRAAVLGGGTPPGPGEISLAHCGVLFLDEMQGFSRDVLDGLRQPLEEHRMRILRRGRGTDFPADFMMMGAANPCRCGKLFEPGGCRCTDEQVRVHMARMSGPLLSRFDLRVEMTAIDATALHASVISDRAAESSQVRERIRRCWDVQLARSASHGLVPTLNGRVPADRLRDALELGDPICRQAAELADRHVSARGFHRMLRVARSIADWEGERLVALKHVQEAYQYRVEREGLA